MPATYVYGITASGARAPEEPGIEGVPLQMVEVEELSALVSELPAGEAELGREALERHSQILAALFAEHTVLPARFGVVMPDAETVREELLDRHRSTLREQLAALQGKVELRLRATYLEEPLLREVLDRSPEIAGLRRSLAGVDEHAAYFERIRLGQMIAQAVDDIRDRDATAMLSRLEPLAVDLSVTEPTHERMALNASFLVDRQALDRFDRVVDELGREHDGRLRLKYAGPLPPYSFVKLQEQS